jgi:hypothetical protein
MSSEETGISPRSKIFVYEFSFCNNTETLFPGTKILLHHNLAPYFGCNSPVSWKYSMIQCFVVHFLSSDFLKLPESKCILSILYQKHHTELFR